MQSDLQEGHTKNLQIHHALDKKIYVFYNLFLFRLQALRLSQTALGETSPGKVINLLSNDVSRFDAASFFFNALWISPLLTFIVGCLLWNEVGSAGLVGISVVLTMVPMLSKTFEQQQKHLTKRFNLFEFWQVMPED